MILVDTSAWVDFFRGNDPVAERVDQLIEENEAALCGPVLTELRRGLRSAADRKRVLPLLSGCHHLDQPEDLWVGAGELGYALSRRGATVKTLDLLIATYAVAADLPLLTTDADFEVMRRAGAPLKLVSVAPR